MSEVDNYENVYRDAMNRAEDRVEELETALSVERAAHEATLEENARLRGRVEALSTVAGHDEYHAETVRLIEKHHLSTGPAGDGSRSAAWEKGGEKIHNADTLGEAVRAAVEAGR